MTEWHLQKQLTSAWIRNGISIDDNRLFLAAWEVMTPSWKINDAAKRWGEPAIDFLGVASNGDLAAIELKRNVRGRSDAWVVLCQVTASAAALAGSFSVDRLERAYKACWTGQHGRTGPSLSIPDLEAAVSGFFGADTPELTGHVQRAVVAVEFGTPWPEIVEGFDRLDIPSLVALVSGMQRGIHPTKSFQRILALSPRDLNKVRPGVWWSNLEGPVA